MKGAEVLDSSDPRAVRSLSARPMVRSWLTAATVGAIIWFAAPPAEKLRGHPAAQSPIQSARWTSELSAVPMQPTTTQKAPSPAPVVVAVPVTELDTILDAWENASHRISYLQGSFTCCKYDPALHPTEGGWPERPYMVSKGEFRFSAPNKWLYQETAVREFHLNPYNHQEQSAARKFGEHWCSDGNTLYQIDDERKTTTETPIQPDQSGRLPVQFLWWRTSILMPPVPFVFGGVQAGDLKARYKIRTITPPEDRTNVWLELIPIDARDAANFVKAEVILRKADMFLSAVQFFPTTNGEHEVFIFQPLALNWRDLLRGDHFSPPIGYKRIPNRPTVAQTKADGKR
jgi:hypothetical protein